MSTQHYRQDLALRLIAAMQYLIYDFLSYGNKSGIRRGLIFIVTRPPFNYSFLHNAIAALSLVLAQQLQQSCWLYKNFVAMKTFFKLQEIVLNHLIFPNQASVILLTVLGDHCEKCSDGWYGNATDGTPEVCSPCPCPAGPNAVNQFSKTCVLSNDGLPTCDNCSAGHEGRYCERCMDGYFGRPRVSHTIHCVCGCLNFRGVK